MMGPILLARVDATDHGAGYSIGFCDRQVTYIFRQSILTGNMPTAAKLTLLALYTVESDVPPPANDPDVITAPDAHSAKCTQSATTLLTVLADPEYFAMSHANSQCL